MNTLKCQAELPRNSRRRRGGRRKIPRGGRPERGRAALSPGQRSRYVNVHRPRFEPPAMPGARAFRVCRSIYGARNRKRELLVRKDSWCGQAVPDAGTDFRFATYRGASESVPAIGDAKGQLRFTLWTAQQLTNPGTKKNAGTVGTRARLPYAARNRERRRRKFSFE